MPNQLTNILESIWSEHIKPRLICPSCEQASNFEISITAKSVKVQCNNKSCSKIYFYRRVNLGVIEK